MNHFTVELIEACLFIYTAAHNSFTESVISHISDAAVVISASLLPVCGYLNLYSLQNVSVLWRICFWLMYNEAIVRMSCCDE